jgi:RNA polymerase sigma-70 factor (ECF subfamily)
MEKKENQGFDTLYERYKKMVYRHCLVSTLNKEDALDLFQEIWLKVYVNLAKFREIEKPGAWIKTVTINTIKDYLRRKKQSVSEFPLILVESVEEKLGKKMSIKETLKKLSPQERYLLFLRFYEEKSYQEIAQLFATSEGAIKMKISRILKKLRKING